MSSNNNDDILTYVNDNIKIIEKYFSRPLSEVKSKDEKKAIILDVTRENRTYDLDKVISENEWNY